MEIKYAFFDFDDTLCLWRYDKKQMSNYYKDLLSNNTVYDAKPGEFWHVNNSLKPIIEDLTAQGIKCFVLTWTGCSLYVDKKKEFCDKYFPGCFTDVLGVSHAEDKVKLMTAYAERDEIWNSQILFVDDLYSTLELARSVNICTTTPQLLMQEGLSLFDVD